MDLLNALNTIPKTRLLLYAIIVGLLPLVLVMVLFFSSLDRVDRLSLNLQSLEEHALRVQRKQSTNMTTRNYYRDANRFYIDTTLETLQFLQPEIDSLTKIVQDPNFIEEETTRRRLNFLTSKQNRLAFAESNVQTTPYFQEVTETLLFPVEMNLSDLLNVLSLIEGREIDSFKPAPGRPQLIILDFKLEKKAIRDNNEVLVVNLKLLKRDYQ